MHVLISVLAVALVPAGTRLDAQMNRSIGTARALGPDRIADVSRAGEEYTASLTAAVVDGAGRERIPAGAVLQGRVAALAAGTGARPARLELTADALDGRALRAHVVAAEVERLPSVDLGESAQSAAFVGVLLGGICFGIPGVMIGYGASAGHVAVAALHQRRVEAWLSAGASIVVVLDEPLQL